MPKRTSLGLFAALTITAAAACGSEDRPVGGADPAGMGAGRPDTTASQTADETDAARVLDGADVMPMGTQQDTSDPGGVPGQPRPPRQ